MSGGQLFTGLYTKLIHSPLERQVLMEKQRMYRYLCHDSSPGPRLIQFVYTRPAKATVNYEDSSLVN